MEAFRGIVLIACLSSIAISMFDIITPEGKFKKQVRLIFSLVFLITIITPIMKNEIELDFDDFTSIQATAEFAMVQDTFNQSLADGFCENLENSLKYRLSINEINAKEISVIININNNDCIDIIEVKIVLAVQDKNKSDKVKSLIKQEIGEYPVTISFSEDING